MAFISRYLGFSLNDGYPEKRGVPVSLEHLLAYYDVRLGSFKFENHRETVLG